MITSLLIKLTEHTNIELTYNSEDEGSGAYLEIRDESGDAGVSLYEDKINELFTAVTIIKTRMATVRNQKERAQ